MIPEHEVFFLGGGTRLLAYDLRATRQIWQDSVVMGFWGWDRHGDVVLMSAELELAAWDVTGSKLWSTNVEPPWSYEVRDGRVKLDVMGKISDFDIRTGRRTELPASL